MNRRKEIVKKAKKNQKTKKKNKKKKENEKEKEKEKGEDGERFNMALVVMTFHNCAEILYFLLVWNGKPLYAINIFFKSFPDFFN